MLWHVRLRYLPLSGHDVPRPIIRLYRRRGLRNSMPVRHAVLLTACRQKTRTRTSCARKSGRTRASRI